MHLSWKLGEKDVHENVESCKPFQDREFKP
jgi:hypothetical protein